jgi:hypothetical protein
MRMQLKADARGAVIPEKYSSMERPIFRRDTSQASIFLNIKTTSKLNKKHDSAILFPVLYICPIKTLGGLLNLMRITETANYAFQT